MDFTSTLQTQGRASAEELKLQICCWLGPLRRVPRINGIATRRDIIGSKATDASRRGLGSSHQCCPRGWMW